MKEIVTYYLSGKKYGVEVNWLQGIENYQESSAVSGMPDFLLGNIIVREQVVPVLDIKKKLILPDVPISNETKYLVFRTHHGNIAVIADGVSNIIQADGSDLQACPVLIHSDETSYVDFVVNHEKQLVLTINPENLLTAEEWNAVDKMLSSMDEEK